LCDVSGVYCIVVRVGGVVALLHQREKLPDDERIELVILDQPFLLKINRKQRIISRTLDNYKNWAGIQKTAYDRT
jgi:hypothetical protein